MLLAKKRPQVAQQNKGIRRGLKKNKTLRKRDRKSDKVEDKESKDEYCLVCVEPYSNSAPGEAWVRCTVCRHWAHDLCTDGKSQYVCQNCDSDDDM